MHRPHCRPLGEGRSHRQCPGDLLAVADGAPTPGSLLMPPWGPLGRGLPLTAPCYCRALHVTSSHSEVGARLRTMAGVGLGEAVSRARDAFSAGKEPRWLSRPTIWPFVSKSTKQPTYPQLVVLAFVRCASSSTAFVVL